MERTLIIGSPGSGKTTFAIKLAKKLNLPLIHLDYYYHQSKFDYYNNLEDWRLKVKELSSEEKWIIDGNYSLDFDIRAKRADCIIFMKCSRYKAVYRVLKRHITQGGKRRAEMPSDWTEKFQRGFLKYVWNFNKKELPRMYKVTETNKNKEIIILKNSKQARKYLKML